MEGADVIVVGGGNSAGQAAVHTARFARSVTIMVRRPDLTQTMSHYLINEIEYNRRITVGGCAHRRRGWHRQPQLGRRRGRQHEGGDASRDPRAVPPAGGRTPLRLVAAADRPGRQGLHPHGARRAEAGLGPTACRPPTSPPRCPASSRPATSARGR
ncbi:NAD(P)-binding domain-containing protein [Nocardioides sp. B-3]|uniref:NAD(P)-binding domain-containing protein n=1 Tax=Nocardioides sp. B-3 TaxID=2895565 RepID=UPI002152091E|nr:NAD(P)-binding domain-containing protein [Nocardioides sp. B-3]UUZ57878.1 NAD(P)-binding domain-containing protein [Nocardioides sp. B-3]